MIMIKDQDIKKLFLIGCGIILLVVTLGYLAAMDRAVFDGDSDREYILARISKLEASIPENLVNINTADEWQLQILPSIGQVKAKAIVDYRNKNGPYQNVEDLLNVKGINIGNLEQIRDKITIKGQTQ